MTPLSLMSSLSSPLAFKTQLTSSSSIPFPCPNHRYFFHFLPISISISISPPLPTFASPTFQQSTLFTPFSLPRNLQSAEDFESDEDSTFSLSRPCELYVCNLPRSLDIPQLLQLFTPYGTVQSVQVSRNLETGISRGCGYVTMSSLKEAKAVIYALDGSDVDGREMRVKFSVDMDRSGRNLDALNSPIRKELIFESPYKLYVGNLIWAVKPEDLRNLFSQFGTVVSARVLHDRRGGKKRVYGFVSFSEAAELAAALSLNGTDYYGRNMLVREVMKQSDT